jgi:hypothetical protein
MTLLWILLCTSGCGAYTHLEMQLVEQARKGVSLGRQHLAERGKLLAEFNDLQTRRLDAAFDADVREHSALSADWVIEHRQAYALALAALQRQHSQWESADAAAAGNLKAADAALERLHWLQSLRLQWLPWKQEEQWIRHN